ncbi:unnamed protein product [Arctogadus glacialis]
MVSVTGPLSIGVAFLQWKLALTPRRDGAGRAPRSNKPLRPYLASTHIAAFGQFSSLWAGSPSFAFSDCRVDAQASWPRGLDPSPLAAASIPVPSGGRPLLPAAQDEPKQRRRNLQRQNAVQLPESKCSSGLPQSGLPHAASPSLASPSLASPSLASPSLASPSLASPSLASPTLPPPVWPPPRCLPQSGLRASSSLCSSPRPSGREGARRPPSVRPPCLRVQRSPSPLPQRADKQRPSVSCPSGITE